jgi:plastocyanin
MIVRSKAFLSLPNLAMVGALVCGVLLVLSVTGPTPVLQQVLGMSSVHASTLPRLVSVVVSPRTATFSPRVTVVIAGGGVTFANRLATPLLVRSAAHDPAQFAVRIAARGQAIVRLVRPGLYHYYDALTARPRHMVAGNDVIVNAAGAGPPRQGWIAVLVAVPGLHQQLVVPPAHDLFAPKVVVGVVGSTITVSNHDSDAHNFVVDPASPTGAAFIINGTDAEPPHGWRRSLVVQQPGLYHVYCTMHTRVVGTQDGWHVVVPRPIASGYKDHDPMEAWVVVLPANTTT